MKWFRNLFVPGGVWVVRFHSDATGIVSRVFYDETTKKRYVEMMAGWGYATIMNEEVKTIINNSGD